MNHVKVENKNGIKLEGKDTKIEVKTEVKSEVKTEVKSEVKTEVKSEVKTEVKSENEDKYECTKSKVKTEVKSKVNIELKADLPNKNDNYYEKSYVDTVVDDQEENGVTYDVVKIIEQTHDSVLKIDTLENKPVCRAQHPLPPNERVDAFIDKMKLKKEEKTEEQKEKDKENATYIPTHADDELIDVSAMTANAIAAVMAGKVHYKNCLRK